MTMKYYFPIFLVALLSSCASPGHWQFDSFHTATFEVHRSLPLGSHTLHRCSARSATGAFTISYSNGVTESHSFCARSSSESGWASLNIGESQSTICFWEGFFDDSAGFIGGGIALTDCHSNQSLERRAVTYQEYYGANCRRDVPYVCVESDLDNAATDLEELIDVAFDYQDRYREMVAIRKARTPSQMVGRSILEVVAGKYYLDLNGASEAVEEVHKFSPSEEGFWKYEGAVEPTPSSVLTAPL